MFRETCIVAHGLQREHGLRQGDRVAIVSRNTMEFVCVFWALHLLGCVVTCVNVFQQDEVMAACINLAGARMVIMDQGGYRALEPYLFSLAKGQTIKGQESHVPVRSFMVIAWRDVHKRLPRSKRAWLHHKHCRVDDWDDALARWRGLESLGVPKRTVKLSDPALMMFTSGTTSLPKAVISTNDQVISSVLVGFWYFLRELLRLVGELPSGGLPNVRRSLCMIPLFHVMGLESVLLSSTITGDLVVFMHKYSKEHAREMVKREQITSLIGVGFMVQDVMTGQDDLSSVTSYASGGAAPPETLSKLTQKSDGALTGGNGYGLTETNSAVIANLGSGYRRHPLSIGVAAPFAEIKICDPGTGRELPRGAEGELWVRAPNVASGYYRNAESTAQAFDGDRYFHSGDLAKMDDEGFIWIQDRIKDLIIRKGENISCHAVETSVMRHDAIKDCAAVGLRDDDVGERVAVICVVDGKGRTTEQAVVDVAATSLPRHAVPDYVWLRKEPLPRNATGKVLKTQLRKELESHVRHHARHGPPRKWTPRSRL